MAMNLLSANDFDALGNAMRKNEEISMWRSLGNVIVRANTRKVGSPWPVGMILQIQMEKGNIVWIQNFSSVMDAKASMDRWNSRFHWIV